MAIVRITTPEPGWSGPVGTIRFVDGVAEVDETEHALSVDYCRKAGYLVEPVAAVPAAEVVPDAEPFAPLPGSPGRGASKADWVVFATTGAPEGLRLAEEQAEALTRDQLAEKYLGPKE